MKKMNTALYTLLLVMSCIYDSKQRSTPDSTSYVAAVVEYTAVYMNDGELTTTTNAQSYVGFIEEASNKSADIVAFPESGLTSGMLPGRKYLQPWTTIIPDAKDHYTPCTQNSIEVSKALKLISCAAKDNKIYVVANIPEKLPCKGHNCPSDNFLYYNTNVVFDRNGTVIAKYRKTNLFGEYGFNVTETPEIVTFDTDFGVTFGTFICFDILFSQPGLNLTRIVGVKDVIFTSAWFSQTPFLTAVQVQYGWSMAEDVNLLAAGYNNPIAGSGGSGIYLGREGVGTMIMPLTKQSTLLTYKVPKKVNSTISAKKNVARTMERFERIEKNSKVPEMPEMPEVPQPSIDMSHSYTVGNLTLIYDNLEKYKTELLTKSVTNKTLCQDDFCCSFSVSMNDNDPNVKYLLTVFKGIRVHLETIKAPTRACGVIQCGNESSSSCNQIYNTNTTFNSISIMTTIKNFDKFLIMPVTLNTSVLPMENFLHQENSYGNNKSVSISMNKMTKNLVTFAFYARYYGNDEQELSENSADIGCLSPLLPLIILLYLTIMG